jgi:uncharacterized membrane protein
MPHPPDLAAGRVLARGVGPVGVLALTTVALQISYPLTDGDARRRLTIAAVLTFAAASVSHARLMYGGRGLACCLAAGAIGLVAEVVGVHSGVPFGHYAYTDSLGPAIAGAPAVVGLAWTMMAWPAAVVARLLAASTAARVLIGAWALATWDLFLDPQMVADGHWRWAVPSPHLPGVDTVPLTNFAGWLAASALISLVAQGILGTSARRDDGWMCALYLWTYASSVVAQLAFLHLQAAALWGALGMGAVAVPLALRIRAEAAR